MNQCVQIFVVFLSFLILNATGVLGLKCYQCSNTENCKDPFKLDDSLLQNCTHDPIYHQKSEAIVCRKLRQTIDGNVRITRSCGYVPSLSGETSCFKDAYTAFTSSIYCDCEGDGCNYATHNTGGLFWLSALAVVVVQRFMNN